MATKEAVQNFLSEFFGKLNVFEILFRDDRGKNSAALAELEITANTRTKIIKEVKVEDYSDGPIPDTLNGMGEMWVFGKDVKGQEVYIKISLGRPNSNTICISFHIAQHPMKYPFKE